MKLIKFLFTSCALICLSGCVQQLQSTHKPVRTNGHKPHIELQGTATLKRLNTIDCKDYDDWYLDGYRIGKSFQAQKAEMYSHRVDYCKQKFPQFEVSRRFQQNWDRGYNIAANIKPKAQPAKSIKYKNKKKARKMQA